MQTSEQTVEISHYELERGKPIPSKLHAQTQGNLLFLLKTNYSLEYNFLPELRLSLNAWDSVPDISIYPKAEIDFSNDETALTIPPLCAVEIISPSQNLYDLIAKAQKYFENSVKSCWLVIPLLKNIYVFESLATYEIFRETETLLDKRLGIEIQLSQVFR